MSSTVKKFQLIEVVVAGVSGGNNATRFQFPDQPYLRYCKIWGIEVYNVLDIPTSLQGNAVISNAQMIASFLTLYLSDPEDPTNTKLGEWVQNVPFSRLHNVQNGSTNPFSRMPFNLVGQQVQWEKCYINIPTAFANTSNVSFLFGVYFTGNPAK